jgi:hypothetical protein
MSQRGKDLDIEVTPLVEDVFYLVLALEKKISGKQGEKIFDRIKGKWSEEEYLAAIQTARKMIKNIEKYGVACAAWE